MVRQRVEQIEIRGQSIECVSCGALFYLTAQEEQWFTAKRLSLPARCRNCRKTRRWKHTIDVDSEKVKARDEAFELAMRNAQKVINKYR